MFSDKELGMDRSITRRDFMNGAAVVIGAAMLPGISFGDASSTEAQNKAGYYPPAASGMRGSHAGAFDVAHSLRDGTFWSNAGTPTDTGERYDLVVVGGGISGLAAARYFREAAGKQARVLIIENHDDFGGHAKRNEFEVGGRKLLGFGGTFSIETPSPYSAVSKKLIEDLGIVVSRFPQLNNANLFSSLGLHRAIFFGKEMFGTDRLVRSPFARWGESEAAPDDAQKSMQQFFETAPLNPAAKADLKRLFSLNEDLLPGLSSADKKLRLAKISYAEFLSKLVKVDPQVVAFLQNVPHGLYGLGIDAVSAQDAWGLGLPGFDGLKLPPEPGPGMGRDAIRDDAAEKYFFHFPDGNASIARLLVRGLIPEAVPGSTADDVVTAHVNYGRLDEPKSPVRIRLNSTVARVRHVGNVASAKEVEIAYVQKGKLYTVRAAHCVLACWHTMIPFLCEELPDQQIQALSQAEKVPIVYTNVALRNWQPFVKLGVSAVHAPGGYFSDFNLDQRVSIGEYKCTTKPQEPIVVHMMRTPCRPGLPGRTQHRRGRAELYVTSFEVFERNTREQLLRTLGAGGFDAARDIAAITVNRWPHGYAYQYNSLWDPFWLEGGPLPCVQARQPFGRVAIANADADAFAYTNCAIDQAYRAVNELKIGS